jgi:hypothetical protein
MKPRLIIGILIFALVATTACNFSVNLGNRVGGSGNTTTEERSVSDFDKVALLGAGELYIEQGQTESLTVETDDNLMQYITTEVKDGRLELGIKPNINIFFMTKIVYRLTVIDLREVKISGSGKVITKALKTDNLVLGTSGSGKFEVEDLKATRLEASTSGSGEFTVKGKVDALKIEIGGSGKFINPDLQSRTAEVRISGSGNVTVWTSDSLDVTISGSGSVRYYGKPQINQTISGSGNVTSLGTK